MYQDIIMDVYKQWLEEFDHEAAIRRNRPRREREWRVRSAFTRLRGRAQRREAAAAAASSLADA